MSCDCPCGRMQRHRRLFDSLIRSRMHRLRVDVDQHSVIEPTAEDMIFSINLHPLTVHATNLRGKSHCHVFAAGSSPAAPERGIKIKLMKPPNAVELVVEAGDRDMA